MKIKTSSENQILDMVLAHTELLNDAQLSKVLHVLPPVISKLRHGKLPLSGGFLLRIQDITGISVEDLRAAGGLAVPDYAKS